MIWAGGWTTGGLWGNAPKTHAVRFDRDYGDAVLIWQGPLWTLGNELMHGPWEVCRVGDDLSAVDGRLVITRAPKVSDERQVIGGE